MATACVKLIEDQLALSNIIIENINDPVKIAIKDGDKYTVKDSNTMDRSEFEKNHLFVEINATPADAGAAEENTGADAAPDDAAARWRGSGGAPRIRGVPRRFRF